MALRARANRIRERRLERRLAATRLIRAFARDYPEAFLIEIGANDGIGHNPLHRYLVSGRWSGILVEPAPSAFARLERTYADCGDRLVLEQAAIADHDGKARFFTLEWVEDGESRPLDVFGSLSVESVERSGAIFLPEANRRIDEIEVDCLTFQSLCDRHRVENVDLLVLDAEGADYELLKQIDIGRYRPRLLAYEHLFLSEDERDAAASLLAGLGYETLSERRDTWCLDVSVDDRLTRTWRGLRPAVPADTIEAGPG